MEGSSDHDAQEVSLGHWVQGKLTHVVSDLLAHLGAGTIAGLTASPVLTGSPPASLCPGVYAAL